MHFEVRSRMQDAAKEEENIFKGCVVTMLRYVYM